MIEPGVLLAAAALDLLLGDPRWLTHPVVCIGKLITLLESVLRRFRMDGRAGGMLLLIFTVAFTMISLYALIQSLEVISRWAALAGSLFFSYACLAARSLHMETKKVADALSAGDLSEARRLLSYVVGRDTNHLEEPEIWRALVETVAENTSDGVIAPLMYLMIGGPVLGLGYKAVNTMDSMVGYKNERYLQFGWASARFDDVANFVPARLTGLLMVAVAPLVGLNGRSALKIMRRDGGNHSSPNSGIPEAAAAGALGVRIGGTSLYGGVPVDKPFIGDIEGPVSAVAFRGAVRLMYGTEFLFLLLWLVGMWAGGKLW